MPEAGTGPWWNLIRFGFRLLYNEMAFTYDTVSTVVSLGAWRCWQRAALRHLPAAIDAPILELAHGTGDLQLDLSGAGYRAIGYDLSPYMGRITQAKFRRQRIDPRLVRGRAQDLPFAAGQFGAVISTFPTNFIVEPDTLAEVARVLQPGGRLVIVPSATFTSSGALTSSLEWLYRITGQRQGVQRDSQAIIERLFAPYGFTAQVHQERCPRSTVIVIVAQR
ncbi:MAG: class I SAM-dependent methyltransferase [Chloroflexi bacterium]|nr:class I SAM-dependent methyltransferase [Chloroflexota bacterium]